MTRVLALDISGASTGVAIGHGAEAPRSFAVSFDGATRGHVGAGFAKWLRDLMIVEQPDLVVFEAPLRQSDENTSIDSVRLLTGLSFTTETICAMRGVKSYEAHVQSWRKVFLGHGRPANPKKAALAMCQMLGWDAGGSHDRADALGVWCWAHFNYGDRQEMQRALSGSAVRNFGAQEARA